MDGEIDGLTDLGEHRLKDLSRHERVWQVPVPNGPTSFPALNTVDGRRGNLPAPTTSFVGREAELDEFEALLAGCRLLTLVGAGGSGKTRLALELAARVSDQFEGGVWVVDLWQIDDPGQIEDAVIATLGLQYGQDRDGRQVLVGALDYSPVLVVLDTCEHLVEAVADLADFLIGRCPELTVIATSREVLPTSSALARPVEALGEGVELFAARAGATRNGFTLTDSNRDAVDRICRQLDGIPLAIELVAARTATLDLAAIESRLHDVFRFVRGLARGQSERHSTLETTIGWSYELLEPAEQALFDRLSVFLGGFTLEAAERVCSDPEQIDELDVVDLLERLVDKSMVTTIDDDWIGRRYRLLDTTRAFGQARLAAENQTDTWLERHSRFYADWTRRVSSTAYGPEAGRVRREIVAEIPNLRSATEWPTRRGNLDRSFDLARIGTLFIQCNRFDTGEWLVPVLDQLGAQDHPDYITALASVVGLSFGAGDLERAEDLVRRALAVEEHPALRSALGPLLWARAYAISPPDGALLEEGRAHSRRAVEEAKDQNTLIRVYAPFLFYLSNKENPDEFLIHWDRFWPLVEEQDSEAMWTLGANGAGALAYVDPERARPLLERALEKSQELFIPFVTTRIRSYLAAVDTSSGDHLQASRRLLETIEEDAATSAWFTAWGWMHRLARVLAAAGHLEQAVTLHHAIPPGRGLVWVGDELGDVLAQARHGLGDARYDELARKGAGLDRPQLMPWLRDVIKSLESS